MIPQTVFFILPKPLSHKRTADRCNTGNDKTYVVIGTLKKELCGFLVKLLVSCVEAKVDAYHDKVKAIEYLDLRILAPIIEYFENSGDDYKILVMPDHPTPLSIMTHTHEPVPFMIYDSRNVSKMSEEASYDEKYASSTSIFYDKGYQLIDHFLS